MIQKLSELTPGTKIRVYQSGDGVIELFHATRPSNVTATVQSVGGTSDPGTWTITTDVGTLCALASADVHVVGPDGYVTRR